MKPSKERLYDALGELIYAVAKADGLVQDEEASRLKEILQQHPWAREVQWSFDYENNRETSLEEAYQKAIDTCKAYGPTEEYEYLFDILYEIARASDGVNVEEAQIIVQFKMELKEHFMDLNLDE